MNATNYDVIIIGGGPGGYTAALYCARAGLKTLVLEKLSAGGQMATTSQIDNYPGFPDGIDGFELGENMQKGAERFGAVTEYAEVTALCLTTMPKQVMTTNRNYYANAVILAMGASPKPLGIEGESALVGKGVAYCATCDGMYYKDKIVSVAGGGNSAAEDALTLSKLCKKVYLVHRRDSLRATKVYQSLLEKTPNIEFIWNAQIDGFLLNPNFQGLSLTDKITGHTYHLACDGIFVAIGRNPDTGILNGQVTLDSHGYICADETTRTNIPGVYAVGDIRTKPLRQVVTAVSDGAVASKFCEEYLQTIQK